MVIRTRTHTKKTPLLLHLNGQQERALKDLEIATPDSDIKRGIKALLLIVQRTDQILARRAARRPKDRVLGMKEILDRSGYSSRDTLYELVRRYDPNHPSSIVVRKSRVHGATPPVIDALRAAYKTGKIKNYTDGAAWLMQHHGLQVSSATYYRWLESVTMHRQQPTRKRGSLGELARRILGGPPNKSLKQRHLPKKGPAEKPDENSEKRAFIERVVADLENAQKELQAQHPRSTVSAPSSCIIGPASGFPNRSAGSAADRFSPNWRGKAESPAN